MNGNECRYWVALPYFLGVLATLESIARFTYIIVCRLNDTTVFTVVGRDSLDEIYRIAVQKIPDTCSTMFCSVKLFFSPYWQLWITEESSVEVWWFVCACAHTCWWKALPVLLCTAKIILKSLPLSRKHHRASSRDKQKRKGGMQKAEVFVHKPEGAKIFLKEKPKINAMITLNCLTTHYCLSVSFIFPTLLFLKYSFNMFTKLIWNMQQ